MLVPLLVVGCASQPDERSAAAMPDLSGWAPEAADAPTAWQHYRLPGKAATEFQLVRKDGRLAVSARSSASASMLRAKVHVEPRDLGEIDFSWFVPQLVPTADMAVRDKEDAPARLVLAFEGDRSKLPAKDRMLSELARSITGEEMPYATLMYVWCNFRPAGTVIVNPRTDRVRKLVVESGPGRLRRWVDYRRDIRADYEKAFGEAPGALVGVAIMTDTDNTRGNASAWYGRIRFHAAVR